MEAPLLLIICLALLGPVIHADTSTVDPCPETLACQIDLAYARRATNITLACSAMAKGGSCFSALEKKCSSAFLDMLDNAIIQVDKDEMKRGCEGACGKAAEVCVADVATIMKKTPVYNMNVCVTLTKSLKCLENLSTNKCSKSVKTALNYFAKLKKENDFSDLCDNNGKPSACYINFNECYQDLIPVTHNTPWKQACKYVESYLQCESRVDCKSVLKDEKKMVRRKLENMETKYKCPTVGSCNDRILRCGTNALTAINKYSSFNKNKDEICTELSDTISCIGLVKKDPLCAVDIGLMITYMKKFSKLKDADCGGGASSILVSAALIALGLAVSMFKNL